ncbi:unnamed protein product [Rotaria sp. Silwood1]|nr:unnamed protein product [Rotaria sp. Silwood1]CAF1652991.1 unnamed protein product [Rotaria sp. Silwood1]
MKFQFCEAQMSGAHLSGAQLSGSDALQGLLTEQTTGSGEVFDTQLIDSGWRLAEALCKTSCAVFDITSTAFLKLVDDPSMNEED